MQLARHSECRHASSVAFQNKGILIEGPSGIGKSALALELMGLGAGLIADDQTIVQRREARLYLSAPDSIQGVIEARGIGLLRVPFIKESRLALLVRLGSGKCERLPPVRHESVLGTRVESIRAGSIDQLAPKLFHLVKYGRADL